MIVQGMQTWSLFLCFFYMSRKEKNKKNRLNPAHPASQENL